MSTPLPGPNDVKPVSTIPPEPTYPRRGGNYKKKAAGAAGAAGGAKKNEKPKLALAHLVGYQARRGDFETEYEDNAEEILADMEFKVYTKETHLNNPNHPSNHPGNPDICTGGGL